VLSGTLQPTELAPAPHARSFWRAYGRKHHDITLTENSLPNIVLHYTDLMYITDDVRPPVSMEAFIFRVDQDVGDRMGSSRELQRRPLAAALTPTMATGMIALIFSHSSRARGVRAVNWSC
jgi:hypothetical protein